MSLLRSMLERSSRGVVLKRRLPAEFHSLPFYATPDAALKFWKPNPEDFDPSLFATVREIVKPGDVVWDVGANVGLFAFAAAARGATVVALEPDVWLASLLRRSIAENGCPVSVLAAAASDSVGIADFVIAQRGRAANHLAGAGTDQAGGVRETHKTPTVTLDSLLKYFPAPSVLKIDVEGFELQVLRGALELLEKHRPSINCEVLEDHREEVTALLRRYGYRLFDSTFTKPVERAVWNTLAAQTSG
jgi:FkbM family methyltransferase